MSKWKNTGIIFVVIFFCVFATSFVLQKKTVPVENSIKIEMTVEFNEESEKNSVIINKLNRIGILCVHGDLNDCQRNLIPQRELYDGYLPRFPTGDVTLDKYLKNFKVRTTTASLKLFDFEFTSDSKEIQSEDFYLDLINRNIENRLYNELKRRQISFEREAKLKIEVSRLVETSAKHANYESKIQKAKTEINKEFNNLYSLIKIKGQDDFFVKKQMNVIAAPTATEEISLTSHVFRSLFIAVFITLYVLAFYVYYRKKG